VQSPGEALGRAGAEDAPEGTLLYVMDPMCSWCWGFAPVIERVARERPDGMALRWVMGGLAPDSDEPMPERVREYVQNAWRAVASRTGAEFNFEFWERCQPRRSTWPACRAVHAAERQGPGRGPEMARAVQRAYYLEARNPSDPETLADVAGEQGLDRDRFAADLASAEVDALLKEDFALAQGLGAQGFPSLLLARNRRAWWITQGWCDGETVLERLAEAMSAADARADTADDG